MPMKGVEKRAFPYHYAPGKRLFHIVARMSDEPGSFSSILDLLASQVDLIGTETYGVDEGSAVFSGFAEPLSPTQTPSELEKVIMGSKAAREAMVTEGSDGMLVDKFHTGLEVGPQSLMYFRRGAMSKVFDKVVELFGSGGETLLYNEGNAMGRDNAAVMINLIGKEMVRRQSDQLRFVLQAQGWGSLSVPQRDPAGWSKVQVNDCFECSESGGKRHSCNFLRGYLEGSGTTVYDVEMRSEETKCILRGDPVCEFALGPKR
ncbi:MAG: 4-vinyl reductase [archaeon]|nr:MAG: 4-vinyl reductase [archaeon]